MIKRLKDLQIFLSVFLLLIPLILIISSNEVRESISDYAYSSVSSLFALLLSMSAMMFIYNGWIKKKWYNFILGFSLFVVALTPHKDFAFLHYFSASIFFIGCVISMLVLSSVKHRFITLISACIIFFSLSLYFVLDLYSLLVAEWIAMTPICIHFILDSKKY